MTPRAYLDAVRKRCEAATAGPWQVSSCNDFIMGPSNDGFIIGDDCPATDADAEFLAESRTDLPKLERIARLAEDYREARTDAAREALFAALESLP